MKAIEKERNRRYESPASFLLDIRRHLTSCPVDACPPSTGYRLRKCYRRNRIVISTCMIVALVLVSATLFSLKAAIDSNRAKEAAVATEEKSTKLAGSLAISNDKLQRQKEELQRQKTELQLAAAIEAWKAGNLTQARSLVGSL